MLRRTDSWVDSDDEDTDGTCNDTCVCKVERLLNVAAPRPAPAAVGIDFASVPGSDAPPVLSAMTRPHTAEYTQDPVASEDVFTYPLLQRTNHGSNATAVLTRNVSSTDIDGNPLLRKTTPPSCPDWTPRNSKVEAVVRRMLK